MHKKIGILQLCFLTLLLIFVSCENSETDDKDDILECIIANYVKVNKVTKSEYLSVSESQFWSDSTSIIVISTNKKGDNKHDILVADYNGIEVRLYKSSLDKSGKIVDNNWIPSKLEWRKMKKEKAKMIDENYIPIGINPPQIQLVYNAKSNCIEEIILGNEEIISQTMLNCKSCN